MIKCRIVDIFFAMILIIVNVISLLTGDEMVKNQICHEYAILSLTVLVSGITLWKLKYNRLDSPILWYYIIAYACWFGQIILRGFNLCKDTLIIDGFNGYLLLRTLKYTLAGYSLYFFSGFVFTNAQNIMYNTYESEMNKNGALYRAVNIVAIIMILIGFPQFFLSLISSLKNSFLHGYMSIYEETKTISSIGNIISNFKMFFIPGLILLFGNNKDDKKVRNTIFVIVALYVLASLAAGGRGGALAILIVFGWMYIVQIKKIGKKSLISILILTIFVLQAFSLAFEFRISEKKDFEALHNAMEKSKQNDLCVFLLKDMGFNIFSMYHTMRLIPEIQDYSYGYTYFASVMAIIPSFFWGGYSFSAVAGLPNWLMKTLNMDYRTRLYDTCGVILQFWNLWKHYDVYNWCIFFKNVSK